MMSISEKREQLMIYLAYAPDEQVNALFELAEKDLGAGYRDLTEEHMRIVEERHQSYLAGKSKPGPWRVALERIKGEQKRG